MEAGSVPEHESPEEHAEPGGIPLDAPDENVVHEKVDEGQAPAEGGEPEPSAGVGGTGDHPAPATMVDPVTGKPRQHGESDDALGSAPDSLAEQAGGDVSPEARAKLGEPHDSAEAGVETDRPDIGTPTS